MSASSFPSQCALIMEFLEDDQDETMDLGADMEEFTAALEMELIRDCDDGASKKQSNGALSSISHVKKVQQKKTIAEALMDEFNKTYSSRMSTPSARMVTSNSGSPSITAQLDPNVLLGSCIPSPVSQVGVHANTPRKMPFIDQKKPLEGYTGSSTLLSSKKQKQSVEYLDQSIEELNDVVSSVNLREEEEQLFSGRKEDSLVSEASRRFVQEEESRLILQEGPLYKMLQRIIAKCGVKHISKDVDRCLSLCVEERIRSLVNDLIQMSKQRADIEKSRHLTFITSDIRHQILMMNKRAREAEAEKFRKLNHVENSTGVSGDMERAKGQGKGLKVNKEVDDKLRTTAANVAARAAVGGDDMLSKWQLMAERARGKREAPFDGPSCSQLNKETQNSSSTLRKLGRTRIFAPQTRVARNISVKDVIAVLQKEPQLSKSTLMYRLYDKVRVSRQVINQR